MIQKKLTDAEFRQSDQGSHLRLLKRNINILFHDYIFQIPNGLGMKFYDGVLIAPGHEKIRVSNASYEHLIEWLEKGVEMLRQTPDHPIGDPSRRQTEMMIRVYDEGNIYF